MFAPPVRASRAKIVENAGAARKPPPASVLKTAPGLGWDFNKIPIFPPEQAHRPARVIQRKLAIGRIDDPLEHEADRVAARIVRMAAPEISAAPLQVSRQCADCEEEDTPLLRSSRAGAPGNVTAEAPDIVHSVLRSRGRPLDDNSAAFFGARFGRDLAHVRVHDDSEAARSAKHVNARAYTSGEHVVFGSGEYTPETKEGRLLLAHELVHVAQQDGHRGAGLIQRREVDDRSCAGLSDVETEVDSHVNSEINAARQAVGTASPALQDEVFRRLGGGVISPIEDFIENLPAAKRKTPPNDLSGTKYSGAEAAKLVYRFGRNAVASAANVHGQCIGADKLGHFFDLGHVYWLADNLLHGMTQDQARDIGRAAEITVQGLALTGVYSNADQEANLAGWQFYKDLTADPSGLTFAISKYITPKWNEQANPSFYESGLGEVVWNNLLTGRWRGTIGHGAPVPDTIQLDLSATSGGVTGSYEWPVGGAAPNKGTITGGKITQQTTTVSGQIPGDPLQTATPVTGISIEFDWHRGSATGKGVLHSLNEQNLEGTWGPGSTNSGGGALRLAKA